MLYRLHVFIVLSDKIQASVGAAVVQARMCGIACHRTYDET